MREDYRPLTKILLLWKTIVAYLGSCLTEACCSITIWAQEFLRMSFLGSETFSTPQSITECANPTHSLSRALALLPKTLTSVHIFFHGELPTNKLQLMQCREWEEEVRGRTSCPALTCCFSYLASAPALFLSPTLPSVCFAPSLADPNPSPDFLLPQTISIRSPCANSRRGSMEKGLAGSLGRGCFVLGSE